MTAAVARPGSMPRSAVAPLPSHSHQRVLAAVASAFPGAKAGQIKHRPATSQSGGKAIGGKPRTSECWVGSSQLGKGVLSNRVGSLLASTKTAGTLASIGAAPPRRPSQKKANTLATIRESEEWAAAWATSSCAMDTQSDTDKSDSEQEHDAKPIPNGTNSKENDTKPTPSGTNSKQSTAQPIRTTHVLTALQRYGGGKAPATSLTFGASWPLQPSQHGPSPKGSECVSVSKAQHDRAPESSPAEGGVTNEASLQLPVKSTLMQVVGSTNWSSSAKSDKTSSSESSSSANSSPDSSLSPKQRERRCHFATD